MSDDAKTNLIANSVLGDDLTQEECAILSDIVFEQTLQPDEVLFEPNTIDGNLYLLIEGKLDILKVLGPKTEICLNTIKSGSMIGELSFIDGHEHTMRLKSRKESKVLHLSRKDFEGLLEEHPRVVFNVLRSILRFSHQVQRRMLAENLELQRMVKNEYMSQY